MRRFNLVEPRLLVEEDVSAPEPQAGQALIAVKCVGICGSDIHAYYGEHPYISCPIVPGHEFAGIVTKVGEGVDEGWLGRRVTVLPSLVCGKCYNCRNDRFNICQELKVIGCQSDGAFAEFVPVPADKLFALPEDMSWEEAALIEPLAVAVHAVRVAGDIVDQRVVVYGGGPIGLLVMQVVKAYGAKEVILSEPNSFRRSLAQQLGADYVIDPASVRPSQWLREKFGPDGIDLAFECVGIEDTIKEAILSNRKGTTIVVVGVFPKPVMVDMGLVQDRELRLLGTLMYIKEDFAEAMELLSSGRVQGLPLVTHRVSFAETPKAFEIIERERGNCVKLLIKHE
ncbi:MAG TPA: alcohol dehydrogenase catalytic domain-containing protein [Firmicutes bacterium]|nr:alcohol dehydrogenase catalytic domain-containing protein [Bacillota bacterium]